MAPGKNARPQDRQVSPSNSAMAAGQKKERSRAWRGRVSGLWWLEEDEAPEEEGGVAYSWISLFVRRPC